MTQIKPSEISNILKQELSNISTSSNLEETGTVLTVGDGIVRVYGLNNVEAGELIEFVDGTQAIVLNLEEDNIGAVLLGSSNNIKEGDVAKRTKKRLHQLMLEKEC